MTTLSELKTGKMLGAKALKLSEGLTVFPEEVFSLADTLEILDLTGNKLNSLPENFSCLTKLRIIFCSNNQFTELPEVLGQCLNLSMIGFRGNQITTVSPMALPPSLRWLILTDNLIETLPESISNCRALQKLMLAGNRLVSLPRSLSKCNCLELLRISANNLADFPLQLLDLPRLTWLSYSANPFTLEQETLALQDQAVRMASWENFSVKEKLGEGASGNVYRAEYSIDAQSCRSVALKIFKSGLTSDGLPESELAALLMMGKHPNLMPIEAKVGAHPEQKTVLAIPLFQNGFLKLAEPPNFETCTRDVYSNSTTVSLKTLIRLAHGVASAMAHLHAKGILHGDLYGHNILFTHDGSVILGDLGAASFFPDAEVAKRLRYLEVRAFGCLLEELLACLLPETTQINDQLWLDLLLQRCLSPIPSERPLFDEIERGLEKILV